MGPPPIPRPAIDRPEVRSLCERLVPGVIPRHIQVVEPPPGAVPDDCVGNVEIAMSIHGGIPVYGWQLWETLPDLLIEAEFHVVWEDNDGDVLDVSPKPFPGLSQIVFLPDENLTHEGRQIDNLRVALTDDPLVEELIKVAEAYFEATNRGELANYHGYLPAGSSISRTYATCAGLTRITPSSVCTSIQPSAS